MHIVFHRLPLSKTSIVIHPKDFPRDIYGFIHIFNRWIIFRHEDILNKLHRLENFPIRQSPIRISIPYQT